MPNRARACGGHRASMRVNRSFLNPALCAAVLAAMSLGCSSTDVPSEIQISADDSLETEIPTDESLEPEYVRYGDRTTIVEHPACEYDGPTMYESNDRDMNPDALEWLAGFESPVHDDIGAVDMHVQPSSPETGESHPARPFIGYDLDRDRLEVVVVVDPSEDADYTRIASELEEVTSVVNLRIEAGCHTLGDLNDVMDALMDREVLDEIDEITDGYSFGIDPISSTIRIATQRTNKQFIRYFSDRFGDLVSFELHDGHMSELI